MSARLAHVITGLGAGGAEFMLLRLCTRLVKHYQLEVISLTSDGALAAHLRVLGIPVVELGLRGAHDLPRGMRALRQALQAFRPDLIQTWLCHADLLGGLVARYGLQVPVIWGVHQAEIEPRSTPLATRAVLRACAWLSGRVPTRVVSCSEAGRRARIAAGFPAGLFDVITNGVDLDLFHPRDTAGARLRGMLGVAPDTLLVGLSARWHADKDHALLCAAARQVLAACPATCFVLCGEGVDAGNRELVRMIEATGHTAAFRLLGFQNDMPSLLAGLDVGVLSSRTEAFPNVIVETMACAVPFVATDVGDAAAIIGDCGRVAPAGDAAALARALIELLTMPAAARLALGVCARERALAHFSLTATVEAYDALYRKVLGQTEHPTCAAS